MLVAGKITRKESVVVPQRIVYLPVGNPQPCALHTLRFGGPGHRSLDEKPLPGERKARAEARKSVAPLKRASERLEQDLERATRMLADIDRELSEPGLFEDDPDHAVALGKDRARCAERIEALEERWMEALEAYEVAKEEAGLLDS